ncbi:hypothetical protein FQN57_001231 [Myotisia sp. PD_48]|nr:hypothetical protein FQN57_001231 [Myotisia sp. PD_48]
MVIDPLSPIAPARIRALLLPVGKIRRSRFLSFVGRLQAHNVVRLGDVSPDGRTNKNTFSPLAYPSGMIIYDLSISVSPTSHLEVFPFELFRESLVILAIADGAEFSNSSNDGHETDSDENSVTNANKHPTPIELDALDQELRGLKTTYPKSLVQQLLIFDHARVDNILSGPEGVIWVPRQDISRSTTVKTVMCDISSVVLGELQGFSESIQTWQNIDSPKVSSWGPRRTPDARSPEKLLHRMTMPAQLPPRPSEMPSDLDTLQSVGHESPTTFDEITRAIQIENRATSALKSASKPGSKEHSRERMSVSGIGSMSPNERAKSRAQGRLNVLTGLLYLQAGIWTEALRYLVDGAAIARSGSDYIWHAKALEAILICLLLFGWVGANFQIPQLCFPNGDKSISKSISPLGNSDISTHGESDPDATAASLQNLATILPDITNNILNLYNRAANITDEPLPQLIYSETVIRLAKLLATIHVREGYLDTGGLKHIVMNRPLDITMDTERPRRPAILRKTEIASFLFRALPRSLSSDVPITDAVQIFVGIASVLSPLKMERKRAFVLKELFTVLIPGLVQARKIGAAEIGIHPAAGLSALNNESFEINALDIGPENMDSSLESVLALIGGIYGIKCLRNPCTDDPERHDEYRPGDNSADAIISRTFQNLLLDAYGDIGLKVDILRSCINFCEALPDFHGVLRFTVALLQVAKGSSYMVTPGATLDRLALAPDEQARLYNTVKRTVGVARKLGVLDLEADYWDDFMVRGVDVQLPDDADPPVQRTNKEFGFSVVAEEQGEKDPFIYSAFSKVAGPSSESPLIAGESAFAKVTLQNPFDFDLEIEHLKILGEGVPFEANASNLALPPSSLTEAIIILVPAEEGVLTITGCEIKVKCCRSRHFPIFRKIWKPATIGSKLKRTGLASKFAHRPLSWASTSSREVALPPNTGLVAETLKINVIKAQPTVEMESSSLLQSAIMVLEGETAAVNITLCNVSNYPTDLLLFTFQDSTASQLQAALTNKDNLPTDIYEIEFQMLKRPAVRWRSDVGPGHMPTLGPGESKSFTVEIFGKPGLNSAAVQIDYGCVGMTGSQLPESFHTRQITIPLAITVNASLHISRCDILPFSRHFGWSDDAMQSDDTSKEGGDSELVNRSVITYQRSVLKTPQVSKALAQLSATDEGSNYCLLLIDLRNSWPNPLIASLTLNEFTGKDESDTAPTYFQEVSGQIQPGHVSRFALAIPRVYFDNPHQTIPVLNPANRRQFVVSANKLNHLVELANREAFWFREELLKGLQGTWRDEATGQEGIIDLRAISLNSRMINTLRVDDLDINIAVVPFSSSDGVEHTGSCSISQKGKSKYIAPTNTFLNLQITIFNRSANPIHPLIRIQPALRNQPYTVALELSRRLSWTGMLQRALPILKSRDKAEVNLGITVHSAGEYEIRATVEELRVLKPEYQLGSDINYPSNKYSATPSGNLEEKHDGFQQPFEVNAPQQRRTWHSRAPCIISAQDTFSF